MKCLAETQQNKLSPLYSSLKEPKPKIWGVAHKVTILAAIVLISCFTAIITTIFMIQFPHASSIILTALGLLGAASMVAMIVAAVKFSKKNPYSSKS